MSSVPASTDNPLNLMDWSNANLTIDWKSNMGSRGLLINLIHSTWCPPCVEQLIWLQRRNEWLNSLGINTLAIVVDDPTNIFAFNASLAHPLPYPMLADVDGQFSKTLGLFDPQYQASQSAVLLLDRHGRVSFTHLEPHTMPEQSLLQREIEKLPVA